MKRANFLRAGALAVALSGCADPLSRDSTAELRQQVLRASQRQVEAVDHARTTSTIAPGSDLYRLYDPQRIEQLDRISGPAVYTAQPMDMDLGLDGQPSPTVGVSLQQAIRTSLRNNLDVQLAQLQPAISEAALASAEAAFDALLFTDVSYFKQDRPQVVPVIGGFPVGTPARVADSAALTTGIRKPLESGGAIELSTGFEFQHNKTPGLATFPDPAWHSRVTLAMTQPLLRGFGSEINRASILLTRNIQRRDALQLQASLLQTLGDTEAAYWNLVHARRQLAIQQHLLAMMLETRRRVEARIEFDVTTLQLAQAYAFVERQRAQIIRARQGVRAASDELKRLLNDPNLPLSDESLIVPIDEPVEVALRFSLLDTVTTSLRHRPEVRQALLGIDDAAIRLSVADNQRLPALNLNAQLQYLGLGESLTDTYRELGEGDFIEYLIGGQFEMPIGNRAAAAEFRQARLVQQASVVGYRRAVQEVVASVKSALRDLNTAWELIGVHRAARRAAAENLRALNEREELGEPLTPEFLLDLRLTTQQRLAEAEALELGAIIDYNVAAARLHQATGTLLEHNQIDLQFPSGMLGD